MDKHRFAALMAFVVLVPAGTLVGSGLLGRVPPPVLTHPAVVLGGLAIAMAWSLAALMRMRLARTGESLELDVRIATHGHGLHLAALTTSAVLLAVIAGYLFLENLDQLAAL